jgi:hypothetical protein
MLSRLKTIATVAVFCVAMTVPGLAANPYFELKASPDAAAIPIGPEEFATIGPKEITTTIFIKNDGEHKVKGVLMRDLVKYSGGSGDAVKLVALDGYEMDVPMSDFIKYDAVVATEVDGNSLSVRDHGPAWLIYPASDHPELKDTLYESRAVWQIKLIEIN